MKRKKELGPGNVGRPAKKNTVPARKSYNLGDFDAATGKEPRTFKGHTRTVNGVGFAPDGKTVLSGSDDYTLKIWDIQTGRCIKTIPLLWMPREIKAMPGKPGIFATANANGTVTLFDFREIIGEW